MVWVVCHNAPVIQFIYSIGAPCVQRCWKRHPKKEEVMLMDSYYAKRTVALPSRKNK